MMMENIFKEYKGSLKTNYNLAHLTWLKVGGNAEFFYKPTDVYDLQNFVKQIPQDFTINMIGAGSNLLIRDGGVRGVVIKLGKEFSYINYKNQSLIVGCATLNYALAHFCWQNSVTGMEFLLGIPGTIGGGIAMNAGSFGGEFKDIVISVTAINRDGQIIKLSNEQIGFIYRGNKLTQPLIFVEAEFKLKQGSYHEIEELMHNINQKRKLSQPISAKTAGSTFANPEGHKAWQLIEMVGMRGYRIGNAQISDLHCNFLLNLGNATASDLEELAELARVKVLQQANIELKWEVKRIGQKTTI